MSRREKETEGINNNGSPFDWRKKEKNHLLSLNLNCREISKTAELQKQKPFQTELAQGLWSSFSSQSTPLLFSTHLVPRRRPTTRPPSNTLASMAIATAELESIARNLPRLRYLPYHRTRRRHLRRLWSRWYTCWRSRRPPTRRSACCCALPPNSKPIWILDLAMWRNWPKNEWSGFSLIILYMWLCQRSS